MEKLLYELGYPGAENHPTLMQLLFAHSEDLIVLATAHRLSDRIFQLLALHDRSVEKWEKIKTERDGLLELFGQTLAALYASSAKVLVVKGLAVERLYGAGYPRESYDYDLMLKSVDDYWVALQTLTAFGFQEETYPVMTRWRGRVVGVHSLSFPTDWGPLQIELNFGGFPCTAGTWIDVEPMFERAEKQDIAGVTALVPSMEDCFCILIAEAGGNRSYRIRDLVELKVLKPLISDWGYICSRLHANALNWDSDQLERLHRRLEDPELPILTNGRRRLLPPPWHGVHRYWQHAYRYFKREGFSAASALFKSGVAAWQHKLLRWVQQDRWLKLIKVMELFMTAEQQFQNGRVVSFIPVSLDCEGPWEWKRIGAFPLVRTPAGTYLASSFCLHNDEELERAHNIAEEIWG